MDSGGADETHGSGYIFKGLSGGAGMDSQTMWREAIAW
jgi:hypothetical protein